MSHDIDLHLQCYVATLRDHVARMTVIVEQIEDVAADTIVAHKLIADSAGRSISEDADECFDALAQALVAEIERVRT